MQHTKIFGFLLALASCKPDSFKGDSNTNTSKEEVDTPLKTEPAKIIETRTFVETETSEDKETSWLVIPKKEKPSCVSAENADVESLFQTAQEKFGQGFYKDAIGCAVLAMEESGSKVPALHLEAASYAALGEYENAKDSFSGALAIDPNDSETLAAVSEFYINMLRPKKKRFTAMGLQYAERGLSFAKIKRGENQRLVDRLELLVAEAYNDLGLPHKAFERAKNVSLRRPLWPAAMHELAMSSFGLSEIDLAKKQFGEVLKLDPMHAYASHFLGVLMQRHGEIEGAHALFEKAAMLEPDVFHVPYLLSVDEFEKEVNAALEELPLEYKPQRDRVRVLIEDFPLVSDLVGGEPRLSPTIVGLYKGEALFQTKNASGRGPRDISNDGRRGLGGVEDVDIERSISLYRFNLCRLSKDREELNSHIRKTIAHEWGHLNGLNEAELLKIEGSRIH